MLSLIRTAKFCAAFVAAAVILTGVPSQSYAEIRLGTP